MAFKVQLKKLIKIVNPFEHNIFKDIVISIEDIEAKLNTLDIFPQQGDTKEEKIIKEIAYKVANYEPNEIKIRLPEMGEVVEEILLSGVIDLCAAIYRQEDYIYVELISTPKMAKTLLGVDLHSEEVDFVLKKIETILFDWEIPNVLDNTWNNPDYIIQKILSEGNFNDGFHLYKNNIPEEIISTTKFSELFAKKQFLDFLPESWLYLPNFFNQIKSQPALFDYTWNLLYADGFKEYLDGNVSIKNNQDKYITLNAIQNGLFSNKEFCMELLKVENSSSTSIFKFFNEKIVFDSYFMNLNYFYNPHGYNRFYQFSLKDIPESIINDSDWQKDFIKNFNDFSKLSNDDLSPIVKILSTHKNILIDSINQNNSLYSIFHLLPNHLKNDNDVIDSFLNTNSKVYLDLPDNIKKNPDYLSKFLYDNPSLYQKVPFDDIVNLHNKEIFKLLVSNDYKILNNKKFPKEFKEDPNVLLKAGANLKYIGDKKIEKILFKHIETAKELCSFDPLFYWKATLDLRRNPEFALEQLKQHKKGDIEMYLFASKDFCLNALKINEKLADKIPDPYWDDLKFTTKLAEFIDAGFIQPKVFDYAPVRVRHFIDACNVDSDFGFFFKKILLKEELNKKMYLDNKPSKNSKI